MQEVEARGVFDKMRRLPFKRHGWENRVKRAKFCGAIAITLAPVHWTWV